MDVLRFILRLPFILLRLAARSLVYPFTLLGFCCARSPDGSAGVPGWVTFAGNQLARLERVRQPLSENHICLIITDCCGGSGQSYYTGTGIRTNRSRWMLRRWWCGIFPRLCNALRRLIITVMIIQRRLWWRHSPALPHR